MGQLQIRKGATKYQLTAILMKICHIIIIPLLISRVGI